MMLGSQCSPCCSGKIGFDLRNADSARPPGGNSILSCFPGFSAVDNIRDDVSRLAGLKLVFAGYNTSNACSTATSIRFNTSDYGAVKSWIESGGRLVLFSEFAGCITDFAKTNAFLSAMGSSMSWVGGVYDTSCHDLSATPPRDRRCIPGAANIAQGLTNEIYMAAAAEVSGGTSVFFAPSGVLIFSVEQLGNGFLFFCGDGSMLPSGCGGLHATNCEFFKRLYDYADGDVI